MLQEEEQQPSTSQINNVVEGQKANDEVFKKNFVSFIYFPFYFQPPKKKKKSHGRVGNF